MLANHRRASECLHFSKLKNDGDWLAFTGNVCLEFAFCTSNVIVPPPLRILTAYDARLLSWLGSRRATLEVHRKWGVGLYCENIGSKIVYGVKIALYESTKDRCFFYTIAKFRGEYRSLRRRIFNAKYLYWRIGAGSRQPFYYFKY